MTGRRVPVPSCVGADLEFERAVRMSWRVACRAAREQQQRVRRDVSDVQDVGGGILVAEVADPFGNVLGIIYNPHFKVGETK